MNFKVLTMLTLFGFLLEMGLVFAQDSFIGEEKNISSAIPAEIRKSVMEKLEAGGKYSSEQVSIIEECLNESDIDVVIKCFAKNGFVEVRDTIILIIDELIILKKKLCKGSQAEQDGNCRQIDKNLVRLAKQIGRRLVDSANSGKRYLSIKLEIYQKKIKICKKLQFVGCRQKLKQELEMKCGKGRFSLDSMDMLLCKLEEAESIWFRINSI